jgi:hypothetical protein
MARTSALQVADIRTKIGCAARMEFPMPVQIVMDRTGDTRHTFDAGDRAAVEKAEKRFIELTGAGFMAAVRSGPGEQRIIRSFDAGADDAVSSAPRRRISQAPCPRSSRSFWLWHLSL